MFSAFQSLFDRLTSDVAPHDQVRFILNSHQLDRPISLPFLQRDRLTPERFLAAVERVVQSNDQFTLDDSTSTWAMWKCLRVVPVVSVMLLTSKVFSEKGQRWSLLCPRDHSGQSKAGQRSTVFEYR